MRLLFVDNFRGFSDQYIPIADMNFFVGENSTGKTSILSVLNILGSFELWYNRDFSSGDVEFGSFEEVVSSHSQDKSYFSIGVLERIEGRPGGLNVFLMKFTSESGRISLRKFCFLTSSNEFKVIFTRNQTRFIHSPIRGHLESDESIRRIFRRWKNESAADEKSYKPLALNFPDSPEFLRRFLPDQAKEDRNRRYQGWREYPSFSSDLAWIAPIRSKPKTIYEGFKEAFTPEGEHTPYLVKTFLRSRKQSATFQTFVNDFGKNSNLFEGIYTRDYAKKKSSLFELGVILNNRKLRIGDVGYGVSQSLPIVVELFHRQPASWYAIQQPEVHLHPRAQAALGNLFCRALFLERKKFFIETHSDYLIDRFRFHYGNEGSDEKPTAQTLFFERTSKGNRVTSVEIDKGGAYADSQPKSFRDFFIKEQIRLLGI